MAANNAIQTLSKFCFTILVFTVVQFKEGHMSCTFNTNLQGTWKSNAFGTITITSNQLTLAQHNFLINRKRTNTVWDCLNDVTSPYIIIRSELFTFFGEPTYAYICMVPTQANTNSYYFYMNSGVNSFFGNERIVTYATALTPGVLSTAICTTSPSAAEFISMVRQGSESSAIVDCPAPFHSNFTYTLNTGGANLCPSNSFVSICPGRQEMEFDYTKCATEVAFSDGGRLGCVATIDDGSGTIYASLYNFDSTVNNLDTFQFSCAAVEDTLAETVQMTYSNSRCEASQSYSTRPTNGGLMTLTQNGSCEYTTTTEMVTTEDATTTEQTTEEATTTTESPIPILTTDSVNVGAIIGGILAAMLFIILLLLLIIYCIHRQKVIAKQRAIIDRRLKLFKIKQAQGLDDDEMVLTEPSLDPDFPTYFETPKQELLPPVKKYIDTTCQTEAHKEKKKIVPEPIPETGPTPKYLPWPWRTAKRASQKSAFQSQTDLRKFGPLPESTVECVNLADYTVNKYGLRYDDTGVDEAGNSISRPPTRFIPRSISVLDLSARDSKSRTSLSRSSSVTSLRRSHTVLDAKTPTPRIIHLTRSSSMKSLKLTERSQTNILMPVKEKERKAPVERPAIMSKEPTIRSLPHYMYPIRTKSMVTKFDTEKFSNPLAKPLRKEYTLLRPLPNKNKLSKSMLDKAKRKKKKVLKKKKSPYVVVPTPVRQISLLPLNLRKSKDNKIRPDPKKTKQRSTKTDETIFTALSQLSQSVKTSGSNFTFSPETLVSNDINTERRSVNDAFTDQEPVKTSSTDETHQNNKNINDGVERIKADKTAEFQDSGISADDSSSEIPKSEYDSPENGGNSSDLTSNDSKNSDQGIDESKDTNAHSTNVVDTSLKLPRLNLERVTGEKAPDRPKAEKLKLPQIQERTKTSVRPWK